MLNSNIILERLALIKYLYKKGLQQSDQTEPLSAFSLLLFHDSIEMFLALLAEHKGVYKTDRAFMAYWDIFPDLTLKESIRKLNDSRVNIKHKGNHPSKIDIEKHRVITTEFFEENTKQQFNIDFSKVSLLTLVKNEDVKKYLEESQGELQNGKSYDSAVKASVAFEELLRSYEKNKTKYFHSSPFFFGHEFPISIHSRLDFQNARLSEFLGKVVESLDAMRKAMEIVSFGFDYKRYLKFKLFVPIVYRMSDGTYRVTDVIPKNKWTRPNCEYCIDFVLDCALKLQDFDFDIEDLQEVNKPYRI